MVTTIEEATDFFATLYGGEHHIPGKLKSFGQGWCVNHLGDLSTFDFNRLTELVFLAHDRCIRASIMSSGPNMVKIAIWKRDGRSGSMFERHPSLEQAVSAWRKFNKEAD